MFLPAFLPLPTLHHHIIMASLWRHPKSKFWTACFVDASGRRRKRSTKETDRKAAMKRAVAFESAWGRQTAAKQARKVMTDLYRDITGEALANITLSEHCDAWLETKRGEVSVATLKFYENSIVKLKAALAEKLDKPLDVVTKADLVAWRNKALKTLAPGTVSHDLRAWRMLFQAAVDDGLVFENPVDNIKVKGRDERGGEEGAPKRLFTPVELQSLLLAATPEWKSMILFAAYSGLRLGDVAALTWGSLDEEKGWMTVRTRKTGKTVRVPIAGPLAAHIKKLKRGEHAEPVHPQAAGIMGKIGRTGPLSNQFAELLAKCGLRAPIDKNKRSTGKGLSGKRTINELSFHTLRHLTVSLLKDAGAPESVVKAIVGHSSQAISDHYTHTGDDAMRDAIANLQPIGR
jgi:integrase